jgi:hypothetical protein
MIICLAKKFKKIIMIAKRGENIGSIKLELFLTLLRQNTKSPTIVPALINIIKTKTKIE